MDEQYKTEVLKNALQARIKEVTEYQINIDNYRLALEKIKGNDAFDKFEAQLEELLRTSLYEQSKAKIMLEVVQEQLEK